MKSITLKQLQSLANESIKERKALLLLKEEAIKSFGNFIPETNDIKRLAESLNDALDVFERTGRENKIHFKPSLLMKLKEHKSPEVRKFLARTLPLHLAEDFKSDKSDIVRHAIAKRLPLSEVKSLCKKYSSDDQLYEIYRSKLSEAKEEQSQAKKLSLVSKKTLDIDLSDEWYEKTAHKAIMDYGCQFDYEDLWSRSWVSSYCRGLKSTMGIDIDAKKLSSIIKRRLEEKFDDE